MARPPFLRSLTAVLLVLSAAAFAVGVIIERSQGGETSPSLEISAPSSTTPAPPALTPAQHSESGEIGGETVAAPTPTQHSESGETGGEVSAETTPTPSASGEPGESAATLANEASPSGGAGHVETAGEHHAEAKLLGINPESTVLVILVVLLSLALAVALWRSGMMALLIGAIVFGLIFAAFDVREAFHQRDESHHGLLALALIVAVLHVGVALAAALALWNRAAKQAPSAEMGGN